MTRALPDINEENNREEITRRPRSPSPFTAGGRSRSLGARRFSGFSLSSTGEQQQQEGNNPSSRNTTNGVSSSRRRSESQDRRRSLGMSTASELPPIGPGTRPESARSKRSSRDSSTGVPKGILRYEKPELISLGSPTDSGAVPKRSHYSPGSTDSSNSKSVSNNSGAPKNPGFLKNRNKTWCATETNAGHNPKLETLFERNGVSQRTQETGAITNRTAAIHAPRMRGRFASTDSSSPSGANPGLSKRTTSLSNLTKISDNTSRNNNARPSFGRLQRGRSEQNINRPMTTAATKRPSLTTTTSGGGANTRRQIRTGLNHSISQPAPKREQQLNAQNLSNGNKLSQGSSESDCDFNERIISWLDGITEDAPPIEEVTEDEPAQTDTAIHIVYEGK